MNRFQQFLTEQNQEKTLLLMGGSPEEYEKMENQKKNGIKVVKAACAKAGLNCEDIYWNDIYIPEYTFTDTIKIYSIKDPKKIVKIDPKNTYVLSLGASLSGDFGHRSIVRSYLEKAGVHFFNSSEATHTCSNKYLTYLSLAKNKVPQPRSSVITFDDKNTKNYYAIDGIIKKSLSAIGGKFPVILKTFSGSLGIGVNKIEDFDTLKSVVQTLLSKEEQTLLQEYIEHEDTVRIYVLDDRVISAFTIKNTTNKDFRSNNVETATLKKYNLTDEQKKVAIDAAKAVGCTWCGMDMIVKNKFRENYIIDVNGKPDLFLRTYGTPDEEITGNIVNIILKYVLEQ